MRTGRRSRPRPVPNDTRAVESRTRDEICFLLQGAVLAWADVTGRTKASPVPRYARKCMRIVGPSGGEGGIRTPDTVARMPHFECGAFNHSATSPSRRGARRARGPFASSGRVDSMREAGRQAEFARSSTRFRLTFAADATTSLASGACASESHFAGSCKEAGPARRGPADHSSGTRRRRSIRARRRAGTNTRRKRCSQ